MIQRYLPNIITRNTFVLCAPEKGRQGEATPGRAPATGVVAVTTDGRRSIIRRLCGDGSWRESGLVARDLYGGSPALRELRQIKSPNSRSRTPRNSRKTNSGVPLKSPKISVLLSQESKRFSRVLRISNRFWPTNRNRCNSLKTNDPHISNRGQNCT
jgi:hypothetical protein